MNAMTYQVDSNGAVRDQTLVGETVILSDEHCRAMVRSTLIGGVLQFDQPKKAGVLAMSTIKDCTVEALKPQRDRSMFLARFINCRFSGIFSGIDFGRGNRVELQEDFGTVEGCDFTEATLDGCRFLDVDVSTLRFPQKDHAVLVDPYRRSAEVSTMQWPGVLGMYMESCTNRPVSFKATVMHIPSLARLVRCTEEQVRDAFQRFGGIVM